MGQWHNVLTVGWLGAVESEEMVVAPHNAVTVLHLLTFHNDGPVHARPATTQTVTLFTHTPCNCTNTVTSFHDAKHRRSTFYNTEQSTLTQQ